MGLGLLHEAALQLFADVVPDDLIAGTFNLPAGVVDSYLRVLAPQLAAGVVENILIICTFKLFTAMAGNVFAETASQGLAFPFAAANRA